MRNRPEHEQCQEAAPYCFCFKSLFEKPLDIIVPCETQRGSRIETVGLFEQKLYDESHEGRKKHHGNSQIPSVHEVVAQEDDGDRSVDGKKRGRLTQFVFIQLRLVLKVEDDASKIDSEGEEYRGVREDCGSIHHSGFMLN